MSFRRPENYKRYEDVFFYPKEKIQTRVANNAYQNRDTFTFTRNTPISIGTIPKY